MSVKAYRIVRDYPDLIGYAEIGLSAQDALLELLSKRDQFEDTSKPVVDGEYFVREIGNYCDDAPCFTVKYGEVKKSG